MPSFFGHGIVAIALGSWWPVSPQQKIKFWLLAIICAGIPDLDVIAFKFGIPYSHMLGHRGISHSIFFGLFFGILVALLFYRSYKIGSRQWWGYASFFATCTVLHGVFDAMTNGGRGIAFFAPFSAERHFLPWRPIQVSPIHIDQFFGEWGMRVIESEFYWMGIPSLVMIMAAVIWRAIK